MKRLHGSYGAATFALVEAKAEMRARMRQVRRAAWRKLAGSGAEWTLDFLVPGAPGLVAAYHAMGYEINPKPLTNCLADGGWRLALPRIDNRDAGIRFLLWDGSLEADCVGIPAPPVHASLARPDLVIAPLLAFDLQGGRLGQGAGFYDRAIAGLRASGPVRVIGLAFSAQEVPRVPRGPQDELLDGILTETGFVEVVRPAS